MKKLNTLFLAIFISLSVLPAAQAQKINNKQMLHDLTTMSTVLRHLFKTQWQANGNTVNVISNSFSFGAINKISGNYVPDYGVIFTIPGGPPAWVISSDAEADPSSFYFLDGNTKTKVTKESVISRIKEFLRDYAPLIKQLRDDGKVTVIYKGTQPYRSNLVQVFSSSNRSSKSTHDSPTLPAAIYVTAKKSNLEAHRKGSVNDSQFNSRLNIQIKERGEAENRDLTIMSSILKSAFEKDGENIFRIRGEVNPIYINGLGALFYVDASYGSSLNSLRSAITSIRSQVSSFDSLQSIQPNILKLDSLQSPVRNIRIHLDSLSGRTPHPDTIKGLALRTKNIAGRVVQPDTILFTRFKANNPNQKKEQQEAYKNFIQELEETIIDYGRTLKSVQPDEQIYVSVSLPSGLDDIPDRVDLFIKKSALDQLDRGKISRANALDRIDKQEVTVSTGN